MEERKNITERRSGSCLIYGIAGALLAALLWSPLLTTPLWQDDYVFLTQARGAAWDGKPLVSAFVEKPERFFWRPLSTNIYWRFASGILKGNSLALHGINLFIFLLAAGVLGSVTAAFMRLVNPGKEHREAAFRASFVYGLHGAFFLPLAWASGIQELLALLFSALALRGWMACLERTPETMDRILAAFTAPALLAALLCKEGVAMLPLGAAALTVATGVRLNRRALSIGMVSGAVLFLWFVVHLALSNPIEPDSPYAPRFGVNIIRNGALLGLFFMNVPREAIRLLSQGRILSGAIWGGGLFLLHGAALFLLFRGAWKTLRMRGMICLGIFALAAALPYLAPRWNCYPYYILLGLFSWGILAGAHPGRGRRFLVPAFLILAGAMITLGIQMMLPYPSPLPRAGWAEETLEEIERKTGEGIRDRAIFLRAEDENHLAAIGWNKGIAWRLKISPERILLEGEELPREKGIVNISVRHDGVTVQKGVIPESGND